MGAQVLHAILCWAMLSHASGEPQQLQQVNNSVNSDSTSTASGLHTKLYHNVRLGTYASPYGAYSYHIPVSTSHVNIQSHPRSLLHRGQVLQNSQLALHSVPQASIQTPVFKDSYGKFVQPQMAYNMSPQYVQIQALPAHLSQPLAVNTQMFQYNTAAPHFFAQSQFKIPQFKPISAGAPLPPSNTATATQPQLYSETIKSDSPPSTYYTYGSNVQTTYQPEPSTTEAAVTTYYNTEAPTTEPLHRDEDESYTLQEKFEEQKAKVNKALHSNDAKSQESQIDNQKTQTQTRITAIVNGEPTTVTLDTKPPLPLLDISLLEPLTFDDPLVTQMQHFLPKIEQAKYHKLPELEHDDEDDNYRYKGQKVIVEHVYENKDKKSKPRKPKKQEFKPPKGATIGPEISYEIKTPNGKEIYKEQVVSYNKVIKPEPQHFSYDEKDKPEPEVYSYVHNSQEPLAVTRVNYNSKKNAHENDEGSGPSQSHHDEAEDSGETTHESVNDRSPQSQEQYEDNNEPRRPSSYHYNTKKELHSHNDEQYDSSEEPPTHSNLREKPNNSYKQKDTYHPQKQKKDVKYFYNKKPKLPKQLNYKIEPSPIDKPKYHHSVQTSFQQNSKLPKASQYHDEHKPSQKRLKHVMQQVNPKTQFVSIQPSQMPNFSSQTMKAFVPVMAEWEENMRLLSHSAIKVDPYQHVQYGPTTPRIIKVDHTVKVKPKQTNPTSQPYKSHPTHVHEKSKRIIIKDESPQELHMHAEAERIMKQMTGEENNEEDFEKAYKEAALGFPGYDSEDEIERDIFNPEAYGVPHDHLEYNIEDKPFEKYQKKGDRLPKAARLKYKDAADNTKEDYFLDYSVSKPESFLDHHKHKTDYFKMYKKQRPEKIFAFVPREDKKRKPERFVAATAVAVPSYIKPKPTQIFTHHKIPMKLEFDFSKLGFHDSTAFPTNYRFKSVIGQPHFQFGSADHLRPLIHVDSELAAVASNNSPRTEKPTRKKMYKEKLYLKKTRTGVRSR